MWAGMPLSQFLSTPDGRIAKGPSVRRQWRLLHQMSIHPRTYSPFAPPALAGLGDTGQQQSTPTAPKYVDRPHIYVLVYNGIGVNATVPGIYQLIDNDADFYWRGILGSSTNNSAFGIRFQDPNGYYLSTDFISGFVISSAYAFSPFPLVPAIYCPAGSKITVDLQDQSGLGNNILLNFIGVKRYYV